MNGSKILVAALIVAAAIVWHAGTGRYVLQRKSSLGTYVFDTRTGLSIHCDNEHGCEANSVRRDRILEKAVREENKP